MKVEIWSDVLCPFCYIGMKHFQKALEQVENGKNVEVVWHSFLLKKDMKTDTTIDAATALAKSKGQSREWALQMQQQITEMGKASGITFRFDTSVVASSLRAHYLIQLAKEKNVAHRVEELLFKAHFEEGKNIDSLEILLEIGAKAGLEESTVRKALGDPQYASAVELDVYQAQTLGVQGVPFFMFNEKYAVSGAQPVESFVQVLKQIQQESAEVKGEDKSLSCDTNRKSC